MVPIRKNDLKKKRRRNKPKAQFVEMKEKASEILFTIIVNIITGLVAAWFAHLLNI